MIKGALLKLNSLLFGGMNISSLFAAEGDVVSTIDPTQVSKGLFAVVAEGLVDFFTKAIYTICAFVLSIMEFIQYVIMSMLGIDVSIKDYVLIDYNNPIIKIISSDSFTKTFKYLIGLSILFVIIFTIFAIIKSEYSYAANNGPFVNKSKFFARSFRSLFIMGIFPMFFLFGIIMTNAILAGFNDILSSDQKTISIGGQVFISSSYNANNYRRYADNDVRIPISINFDDPISSGTDIQYTNYDLHKIYERFEDKGKYLYGNFSNINFGSFSDNVVYRNNKVVNQSNFSGYENFFCTREQYYVLADFLDFAIKSNLTYYVKNMEDPDIDWGYVDETVFDKETGNLTITYRDTNYLNDGVSYTVVYSPSYGDISTPISDALDTISALLGIGKYGDYTFNVLNRLEDSINVVEWQTDLAFLKFSGDIPKETLLIEDSYVSHPILGDPTKEGINYINELVLDVNGNGVYDIIDYDGDGTNDELYVDIDGQTEKKYDSGFTETDRILVYEKYKYKYNNTLHYTLEELKEGITLPVYKLEKRKYQASSSSYNVYEEHFVVNINGTYYAVEQNKNLRDDSGDLILDEYGDYYYTLIEPATHTKLTRQINMESGYVYYSKDDTTAWNEIVFEKNSGSQEIFVEAEPLVDSTSNGKWDKGEEFTDLNGNGYWDAAYSYFVLYDDQVNKVIKQTGWPQKLINDLQVIYADININNLITTNKWLEQLGEYVAGKDNNSYGESQNNINTALIHPLGLIMAEFFLGEVDPADNSNAFGSTMFNSKFDEHTIKAFLLSLMGEDKYFQLKAELEYFCEIFNVFMGPVLDEIAYFENFDLIEGQTAAVQLYSYKAYLASVMLSASTAEWMHETAIKLLGNAEFSNKIYYHDYNGSNFGKYKTFSEFKITCPYSEDSDNNTIDCGGDGVKEDGSDCKNSGCINTTAYEIIRMFEAQKETLKDQSITEKDNAYPEYMRALEQYINAGFDGRLDIVLSSYLSSIAREKAVVLAHKEIENKYNDLIASCGDDNDLKQQISKIIYVPKAQFVAVDRDGNEWSPYGHNESCSNPDCGNDSDSSICGIEINGTTYYPVPSDKQIVAFKNITGRDAFTMKETAMDTEGLKTDIQRFRNILKSQGKCADSACTEKNHINKTFCGLCTDCGEACSSLCKFCNISSKFNGYFSAIENYIDKKLDYFEEDNSVSNAGERKKLNSKLEARKLLLNAWALANVLIDNEIKQDNLDVIYAINTQEAWNQFVNNCKIDKDGNGTYETDVSAIVNSDLGQSYIAIQTAIDRLDRYNITYGVSQLYSQNTEIKFDVTVNNKTYTVGQNFTQAKFIEYVLGAQTLSKEYNIDSIFVDETYNGLIELDADNKLVGSYRNLLDFLVELGDISAVACELTNFSNLTDNAQDEILIGTQTYFEGTGEKTINLSGKILKMILDKEFLASDLICAMFDIEMPEIIFDDTDNKYKCNGKEFDDKEEALEYIETFIQTESSEKIKDLEETKNYDESDRILNNVLSYLLLTDTDKTKEKYVDYTKLTLKDLRLRCFDFLINYEEQKGESEEQNKNRYLAVFELACADWYETDGSIEKYAKDSSWKLTRKDNIVGIKGFNQSKATVLRLAGLENRPYEELVGSEYSISFDDKNVDEANGDVFIICTYDDVRQIYVPFMMGNTVNYRFNPKNGYNEVIHATTKSTWGEQYGYGEPTTQYYMEEKYYPVVAKGIITKDGLPTAIRKVGDDIEYYRDDVIIHDVSDIGLSQYYVSMDQVTVNHTAISYVANAFSKLFTGKTLVENIASKIPKFSTTTNYNFCYGTERMTVAKSNKGSISMDFNFDKSVCLPIEHLYDIGEINILILVIGTYTLFIALWNALWGVTQRIFDVATLYLLGPLAISTVALRGDKQEKDKDGNVNVIEQADDIYETWKQTLISKVINVFSYAIGFNVFFLISPVIFKVNLFASQMEYNAALSISSIFRFINVNYINEVGRLVLLVAAAFLTTRGTEIFSKIMAIDNALESGKQAQKQIYQVADDAKGMIQEVGYHVSGQHAVDKFNETVSNLKNAALPGMQLAKGMIAGAKQITSKGLGKAAGIAANVLLKAYGGEVAAPLCNLVGNVAEKAVEDKTKKGLEVMDITDNIENSESARHAAEQEQESNQRLQKRKNKRKNS